MSARFDCADPDRRSAGVAEAVAVLRKGELAVLPTDTVYGVAADAFTPVAVASLLAVRARDGVRPPPCSSAPRGPRRRWWTTSGRSGGLIDEFWPGALTLVFRASPTLLWDLGDTKGTVALRMPLHSVALDVLKQTGPLAVSSANRHGQPSATSADEAEQQLGEAVSVYLDGGPCHGQRPVNHPRSDRNHTEGAPDRRDLRGPAARGVVGRRRERALRRERGTRCRP